MEQGIHGTTACFAGGVPENGIKSVKFKAISIRQPWAWLILNAGKDIENREWLTRLRGRVLVHASKGMTRREYEDVEDFLLFGPEKLRSIQLPQFSDLERGGLVGSVDIVDCVEYSSSDWFFGRYGFVLRDPKPMQFVPLPGKLCFFEVDDDLVPEDL